ncbi:MAG: copper chaperone PCu(A)C [Proteobacteria bacterium]|nr:copper chaperone PCu(A)C [Pseudomonadota bacterium]
MACSCCNESESHIHSRDKNITIEDPYFALYKGATNGAAYCKIRNFSKKDKLIKVHYFGDGIKTIELHTHILDENGVAKMREVESFPLEEGNKNRQGEKKLEPGHDHIMLINIDPKMHEKQKISLVLEFENAGKIEVVFIKKEAKKSCCSMQK